MQMLLMCYLQGPKAILFNLKQKTFRHETLFTPKTDKILIDVMANMQIRGRQGYSVLQDKL